MDVILLERIARLGQIGDIVSVKNGYARNFLLPHRKALRANETNKKYFETQRTQLEARNLELKSEAEKISGKLNGRTFLIIRSAGETGQLYGSVSTRDIAELITENGFSVIRNQVKLNYPIKIIGIHTILINLHPEVKININVNVARSIEEAERQAKSEETIKTDTSKIQEILENVEETIKLNIIEEA
ncbi:MAG: large subunit ribosomal protein L9 [Candidatus Tokpelaia sp. JSC189]|nr:MAG: large subunit ribosomal protein L9 [Candidatus Tokpelaia sp. JSC189]